MSFIKATWRVFLREISRLRTHRTFSLLSVTLPLVGLVYFFVLLGNGIATDIPIAILDHDNSTMSRKAARMIDAARTPSVQYHVADMLEAEKLMRQGKIDAVIEFPKHMEKDLYSSKQAKVTAYINGTNVTKNGLLDRDFRMVMYSLSAGIETQMLVKKGFSPEQAYDMMMPVYMEKHVLFNPFINYGYFLLPLFVSMVMLIFVLLSTIFTFGVEFKNGTGPELMEVANNNVFAAFFGKVLPYTVIFTILTMFIGTVMFKFMGVPINGKGRMVLLSTLLFVMAYQSIGAVIITLLANLRLGLSIGGGYSVLAFTMSGMTFPSMAMYPLIRGLSYLFPLTYHMNLFVDQAMRGASPRYSIPDLLALCVFILLPLLVIPRFKKVCSDPKFWGKL